MSDTQSILSEFHRNTREHVSALREEICSVGGRLADAAGDINGADDVYNSLASLIHAALMDPCGPLPEYDLTLVPDWVRNATQPYAPRG